MLDSRICFACLALATLGNNQVVTFLDTRADYVGHKEDNVSELNFATLLDYPKAILPNKFTVCASIFQDNLSLHTAWVQMLKEDFTHWFYIYPQMKNVEKDTEFISHSLWMNVNGSSYYFSDFGPVRYNRWIHACVSMDLVTDLISPVVDGYSIQSKVVKGLGHGRPSTLAGRVILGKVFYFGAWHQANTLVGNLQLFGRVLSEQQMIAITAGDGCGSEGDYLSWTEVELQQYRRLTLLPFTHQIRWDVAGPTAFWLNSSLTELCSQDKEVRFVSTVKTSHEEGSRWDRDLFMPNCSFSGSVLRWEEA